MRRALSVLVAGAALVPLACGSDEDSADRASRTTNTAEAPARATHPPSAGSTRPSDGRNRDSDGTASPESQGGRAPSVFVEAARVCAVGPPAKVAQNLGIKSTDSKAIARALAKGYKPRFRKEAYRGCLVALK